jgi:Cu(I)/Ag(I) efflux system membrane protein CusA/SilA
VRANRAPYLELEVDRDAIARFGIPLEDMQRAIELAVGGGGLVPTYEGLDRYPVRVRYQRELRDDPADLGHILVTTPGGVSVPLSQLVHPRHTFGPMGIRREGAKYVSYVTMTSTGIDAAHLVERGKAVLDRAVIDGRLVIPTGSHLRWTGTYERAMEARRRLAFIIPAVLLVNLAPIFLHFRRLDLSSPIFTDIPVSMAGGFLMLAWWPSIHNCCTRSASWSGASGPRRCT